MRHSRENMFHQTSEFFFVLFFTQAEVYVFVRYLACQQSVSLAWALGIILLFTIIFGIVS